jgi:hypothetical protein
MVRADLTADPSSWVFSKDQYVKYELSVRRGVPRWSQLAGSQNNSTIQLRSRTQRNDAVQARSGSSAEVLSAA